MAIANNCYFNAAYLGFIAGAMAGRTPPLTAEDSEALTTNAAAFATEVDSKIPFDALVTTANNDPTMLVDTASHTIQSDTILRPMALQTICAATMQGKFPTSSTAADYSDAADRVAALFTETVENLVSP